MEHFVDSKIAYFAQLTPIERTILIQFDICAGWRLPHLYVQGLRLNRWYCIYQTTGSYRKPFNLIRFALYQEAHVPTRIRLEHVFAFREVLLKVW